MYGLNAKATIWRMSQGADDVVGGAMVTGTAIYTDVQCRLEPLMPNQAQLSQGLEVVKLFAVMISPGTYIIYERDELEVTWPANHFLRNDRLRVQGVEHDSLTDARAHIELTCSKIKRSRARA